MLPELTEHGAGALTSSKYFGKNGLDALSAILQHADRYGLNGFHEGSYYEPLLVFSGWRKVDDLENRTITVWSKEAVTARTPIDSPQRPLAWEGVYGAFCQSGAAFSRCYWCSSPIAAGRANRATDSTKPRPDGRWQ